jgi:hypothetical protein
MHREAVLRSRLCSRTTVIRCTRSRSHARRAVASILAQRCHDWTGHEGRWHATCFLPGQEDTRMPTQALPVDLPLNWDLALPLVPALLIALFVVVAVGVVLTLSARVASDNTAQRPAAMPRPLHSATRATTESAPRKPHRIAA